MDITEVRVQPLPGAGRVVATASITVCDSLVIHDLRIIGGASGLLVSMPSRRLPGGDYLDIVHPANAETRHAIQTAVLQAYQRASRQTVI